MPTRRRFLAAASGGLLAARTAIARAAGTILPVYFYPPSHRYADGTTLGSATVFDLAQITTAMQLPPWAAGVSFGLQWSTISRGRGQVDFSIIDAALDYWGRRGKKVLLGIATSALPSHIGSLSGPFDVGVPPWAMGQIATYRHKTRVTGRASGEPDADVDLPDWRDERFVQLSAELIRAMGRYDGHPTIETWRMGFGPGGEDNGIVGPLNNPTWMPAYREEQWVDYVRKIAAIYLTTFRRTRLEFDLGRLSGIARVSPPPVRAKVQAHLDQMRAGHVMLGFTGLSSGTIDDVEDTTRPTHLLFAQMMDYQARGGSLCLEAYSPMFSPRMANVPAMMQVIRRLRPERLVLFYDMAQDLSDRQHMANRQGTPAALAFADALTRG